MRTRIAVVAAALVVTVPPAASADFNPAEKGDGLAAAEAIYLARYAEAHREFGSATVGANVVDDGTGQHEPYNVPDELVLEKAERLGNMLRPPPPPPEPVYVESTESSYSEPYVEPTYAPAPAPVASSAGGCVGMEAESGSLGYANNTNPGYIGCYQISDDHYAAGGSCEGLGTDPAGQDACAGVICSTEGAGAWTNPSGQNPCKMGVKP